MFASKRPPDEEEALVAGVRDEDHGYCHAQGEEGGHQHQPHHPLLPHTVVAAHPAYHLTTKLREVVTVGLVTVLYGAVEFTCHLFCFAGSIFMFTFEALASNQSITYEISSLSRVSDSEQE